MPPRVLILQGLMRPPSELIDWVAEPSRTPRTCVYAFTGFLDAGQATAQAIRVLRELPSRLIAQFDTDELLDYRARRPPLVYVEDHFESVEWPSIALHEVDDADGQSFLFLAGPEPDYQWGRFVAATMGAFDRLGVTLSVGLSSVPWPAPHTRPLDVTVHGSDPRLIPDGQVELGTLQVPGHVGGLLELRLGEAGRDCVGIAAHVPHYLAQVDYPRATIAMLEALQRISGLRIPTDDVVPAAERAEAEIALQVEQSEEFASVLGMLEQQYDQAQQLRAQEDLPSGDEIAAQLEQFLAEMDSDGEGEDSAR